MYLVFKILFLLFLFVFSISGVSDKQRTIINNQIFLLKEGMITKDKLFNKAKKFDDTGIFGIGSDEMSKEEFEEYLKSQSYTLQD